MKQVSASEAQTQQHALNSSLRDIVDSSLVHQGGQLLNGSMSFAQTHLYSHPSPQGHLWPMVHPHSQSHRF
ncbi:hypothetical protein TNCV_4491991 [Trichonephila clavipes]|nr:hypothetical protein TNCV_4491991 [Trichonephila clavipes]